MMSSLDCSLAIPTKASLSVGTTHTPRSPRSSRLASSTGSLVVCPGPPPPHRSMLARYRKLETNLRSNWADLHSASQALRDTREDSTRELEEMLGLAADAELKEQLRHEHEEVVTRQLHDWVVRSTGREPELLRPQIQMFDAAAASASLQMELQDVRWPGDGAANPHTAAWTVAPRRMDKEIVRKKQAVDRWQVLFGDPAVACAPPGTGVAAFHQSPRPAGFGSNSFSNSGWLGLSRGDSMRFTHRAKNLGPASAITLPEEYEKRTQFANSFSRER